MKTTLFLLCCGGFLVLIKAQWYDATVSPTYPGLDRAKISRGSGTGTESPENITLYNATVPSQLINPGQGFVEDIPVLSLPWCGVISVGYAFIVLAAFALFVILIGLMIRYLRGKGIRNEEKTLFLLPY